MMRRRVKTLAMRALLALLASALPACGQKGPLYLPDQASQIVTHPAPLPPEPSTDTSPAHTVDSPAGADNPASQVPAPGADADEKGADKKKKDPAAAPR